jgi:hypothetical protein
MPRAGNYDVSRTPVDLLPSIGQVAGFPRIVLIPFNICLRYRYQ